jgi:N-acetylglucosamine-6-phosphate deacetylase
VPSLLLRNALLLDPEAPEPEPGCLLLEGERIAARLGADAAVPPDATCVDLQGAQVAPGFLDLHLHGELAFAPSDRVHEALLRSAALSLRHGSTGFLATTLAGPPEGLRELVTKLSASIQESPGNLATPLGIHLEGPWLNRLAAGAQPLDGIRPYHPAEGNELLDRSEGLVRMVTFAPEVEGVAGLLGELSRRGVVAALGHSLADDAHINAAVADGMTHVTHVFNAMGPMSHREPGVPGLALSDDRLSCDLICDGVHVNPRMVRLAARAKAEKLLLISDRVELPPREERGGEMDFGSGAVVDDGTALRLPDGRLAGSSLHLCRAVRNARKFGAMNLLEAVAACTLRPAQLLGIEAERGTLRPDARADLAVLDSRGELLETWLAGRRVYQA